MSKSLQFLSGGGEMGELIRSFDWSKTTVGSPDTWPQSLRIAVNIMLDCPFGMYIAWGNDYIQLYNDGYRPILGTTKHPQALGNSTRQTFAEIWPTIGPMFEGVMQGTPVRLHDFTLQLNRNGFLEECVFDFSYSPLRLEDGEVGGVLVTVLETTEKIKAIKALKESEGRFQNLIREANVGIIVLSGEAMRVEVVNDAYGRLIELKPVDLLGKPLFDVIPHAEDYFRPILNKVRLTGESLYTYDQPYSVVVNGKIVEGYLNVVYQAYKEIDGTIIGVLALCQDITETVNGRKKIEASEAKFRNLIVQAPVLITTFSGPSFIVETMNEKALELWGKTYEEVINKPLFEVLPELEDGLKKILDDVFITGEPFVADEIAVQLKRTGKPNTAYFNSIYQPLRDLDNEINGVILIGTEVTDVVNARKIIEAKEKRLEQERQSLHDFFTQAPAVLAILKGPEHVFEFANPAYMELIGNRDIINKSLLEALPEIAGQGFSEMLNNVYKTGETFTGKETPVMLNRGNDKLEPIFMNFTYQAFANVKGETEGILVFAYDVTEQVITRKQIEASETSMRLMASHLKLATDSANVGTWSTDMKTQKVKWSPLHNRMWGYDEYRTEITFDDWHKLILPEDKEKAFEKLEEAKDNHLVYEAEYSINRVNDGAIRFIRSVGRYYYNDKGEAETLTGISIDITEQKEAALQLKASEEKYRGIFETIDQGFCIIEMIFDDDNNPVDYLFIEANPIFEKQTGTPNPVGKTMKAIYPNMEDRWFQMYGKVALTGEANRFIDRSEDLNRWFEVYAFKLGDAGNKKVAILFTDISERKQTEEKIEASEEQFRVFADSIQNLAWIADGDGSIYWYNQRWLKYTGLTLEEMKGWGWQKVHHPDHVEKILQLSKQLWTKDKAFELTFPLRRYDGEYRWFLTQAYPVKDTNGRVERWIGTNTDITEQKNSSEELEKKVNERTAQLTERNIFIETLIDSSIDLIIVFDKQLRYLTMNKAANNTLAEHFPDGVIGKPMDEVIPHVHHNGTYANALSALQGNIISQKNYKSFYGNKYFDLDFIPLRNEKEIYGVMAISRDVTENVLAGEILKTKNLALENANAELESFNYVASHDLQEPLRKIQTFGKLILKNEKFSDQTQDYFNRMISAGERMQNLIVSLLDFSKASVTEVVFEPCDLNEIVAEFINDLQLSINEKQAIVEKGNLPTINGSPIQLSQLFTNLIDNAIKYSRPEIKPYVIITASIVDGKEIDWPSATQNEYHVIKIADNGIGFEKEYATKIFTIFQRLHGRQEYSGTGIGLAIVKKIVANHNGFIVAEGVPGIGSTFTIYIPVT